MTCKGACHAYERGLLPLCSVKLPVFKERTMLDTKMIDELSRRLSGLIAQSPLPDLEQNLKPLLQSVFSKLDLVTREEFDVQTQVLQRTRAQLEQLEQRLAALEAESSKQP
jgi:BMFP domain-containing protein YqiC